MPKKKTKQNGINNQAQKARKPRDTSYSVTQKILKTLGEDKLHELWKENGHYKTAKILTESLGIYVTTMMIQYIAAKKFKWKRIVSDRSLSIYKAVLNGKVSPEVYKTIIFQ